MMGNPLAPVLANIYVTNTERTKLLTVNNKNAHCARYIDDTFVLCNDVNYANKILEFF